MRFYRLAGWLALVYLAAHMLTVLLVPTPGLLSNLFVAVPALLGMLAASEQSRHTTGPLQTKWRLLTVGGGLWAFGEILYTYYVFFRHQPQIRALPSDFYFFLWGVPVLLAIAAADGEGDSAALLSMDTIQALLAVGLIYMELFRVRSANRVEALGPKPLMYLYMAEAMTLAMAALLRLGSRPTRREAGFHRVLAWFLCTYALISIPANYADAILRWGDGTCWDVLWDIPFLLLFIGCLPNSPLLTSRRSQSAVARPSPQHLLLANICPSLFTIAVLLLAMRIYGAQPLLGTTVIAAALLIYTVRAAILQTRYLEAQLDLAASREELHQANVTLRDMAMLDPLTGIANRRHFERVLEAEWNRALRDGRFISILMMDIDHFKQLNDDYGHTQGDACLTAVARTLARCVRRSGDSLGRYGGEEFVAILTGVGPADAAALAEEMRSAVSEISGAELAVCRDRKMTISIGLCSRRPSFEDSPWALIEAADAALYRAKQGGRNRVEYAGLPVDPSFRLSDDSTEVPPQRRHFPALELPPQ
jgi:diguanylate cyclase (GGDEF)-like protein